MPNAIRPKPWSKVDVARMRKIAARGQSSTAAARALRRSPGAVRFKAMVEGVRFHAVEQPAGVQRRLGRKRLVLGMRATLKKAA